MASGKNSHTTKSRWTKARWIKKTALQLAQIHSNDDVNAADGMDAGGNLLHSNEDISHHDDCCGESTSSERSDEYLDRTDFSETDNQIRSQEDDDQEEVQEKKASRLSYR
jgi:hypothetical protein